MDTATLDDVIRVFGKPDRYIWGRETFTKDKLPDMYLADYPDNVSFFIRQGKLHEIRFQSPAAGYVFQDKIRVGSSLHDVLLVLGMPEQTVEGEQNKWADHVLYKDIDGKKGSCYYSRPDRGIRLFFTNYKVDALYVTGPAQRLARTTIPTRRGSWHPIQPIDSVEPFDDVRDKDLSKLRATEILKVIDTLRFNEKTIWPDLEPFPPAKKPDRILKDAMDPGLGVRRLHRQGITGKGVSAAIIDQPLYQDHPEFEGKIVKYFDTGCGAETSMHGPAVTSLLVGAQCGTAPEAKVYYAAAPSWKRDTEYEARALDWIAEQNAKLSPSEKIRVVSVSAAPSSPNVRDKNRHMWGQACARAEQAGILVLDCTSERGVISACFLNARNREDPSRCTPGHRNSTSFNPSTLRIHVPTEPRTTAEESTKGDHSWQYCGTGGISWAIPYCAGVLALGWQVNPDLAPKQILDLLFESAYVTREGARIINPPRFIMLVKRSKHRTNRAKRQEVNQQHAATGEFPEQPTISSPPGQVVVLRGSDNVSKYICGRLRPRTRSKSLFRARSLSRQSAPGPRWLTDTGQLSRWPH